MPNRNGDEELLRLAFAASPSAQIIADADGTITRINLQSERLFGYTASEIVGQKVEGTRPEAVPAHPPGSSAGIRRAP